MTLLQFVNGAREVLEQGDVVVIASHQPEVHRSAMPIMQVDLTEAAYDVAVCGIVNDLYTEHKPGEEEADVSEAKPSRKRGKPAPGASQAFTLKELETLDRTKIAPGQIGHLAAAGICQICKVDADIAPIKCGDLLTTSPTKGHGQKAIDSSKAGGSVLGKALGSLRKGKGTIPVLLTLQQRRAPGSGRGLRLASTPSGTCPIKPRVLAPR